MMTMMLTMMVGGEYQGQRHARTYERKLVLLENGARLARKWRTCARILADRLRTCARLHVRLAGTVRPRGA